MDRKKVLGLILIIVSGACFSVATILARLINTTTTITPMMVAVTRFLVAAPLFWLFLPRTPFQVTQKPLRWQFILLGVIFSIANFSANFALNRISSSIYTVILFTNPFFIVLYSLLAKKTIPSLTAVALPLSILGLVLAVYPFKGGLKVDTLGVLITMINSLALAAYYLYSSRLFSDQPSRMPGSGWIFLGSLFVSLAALPFSKMQVPADAREWLLLLAYGTFGTILPIIAANIGINNLGPARAAMTNVIQPILTIILSTIIFSEKLVTFQYLGAFLVILSVVLIQVHKQKRTTLPPPASEAPGEQTGQLPVEEN